MKEIRTELTLDDFVIYSRNKIYYAKPKNLQSISDSMRRGLEHVCAIRYKAAQDQLIEVLNWHKSKTRHKKVLPSVISPFEPLCPATHKQLPHRRGRRTKIDPRPKVDLSWLVIQKQTNSDCPKDGQHLAKDSSPVKITRVKSAVSKQAQ